MKSIVVLGAGVAAMPIIRQVMRTIVLPNSDWKLIVVAPNTHMQYPIPMVRIIVPGQMSEDKAFIPVDRQFKEYPADKFEFVLGKADSLDPQAKTVNAALSAGGSRSITYDKLIIVTGASARDDMPWKTNDSTERTLQRLHEIHEDIKRAKTVLVAGGGPTGTETAAELGFAYGENGEKEVHFAFSTDMPLGPDTSMIVKAQKQAKIELERLNVKLIPNTMVTKVTKSGNDTILELTGPDGKTKNMTVGAYLPATGVTPNTSFVPADMLDSRGEIKQTNTLQAEGYPDIFVAGDAGNLELSKAQTADAQAVHLIRALPGHLLRGEPIPEKALDKKDAVVVTLGRKKGTGQIFGWKLPSFMVVYVKGRNLFTEAVEGLALGKKTSTAVFES
ncbi:hypothetical protein ACO1O0_009332 [Amphichorda felina]